jgi:hypothetical protein
MPLVLPAFGFLNAVSKPMKDVSERMSQENKNGSWGDHPI